MADKRRLLDWRSCSDPTSLAEHHVHRTHPVISHASTKYRLKKPGADQNRNQYYEFFKTTHFIVVVAFIFFLFIHCDFRLTSWYLHQQISHISSSFADDASLQGLLHSRPLTLQRLTSLLLHQQLHPQPPHPRPISHPPRLNNPRFNPDKDVLGARSACLHPLLAARLARLY